MTPKTFNRCSCPKCGQAVQLVDFGDGLVYIEHWTDDRSRCSMSRRPVHLTAVGAALCNAFGVAHA